MRLVDLCSSASARCPVARAIEKGDTNGFMKVVDAETGKIPGAAMLGPGSDKAVHGMLDMRNAGVPYTTFQHAAPIHPTVSELIPTALGELRPADVSRDRAA